MIVTDTTSSNKNPLEKKRNLHLPDFSLPNVHKPERNNCRDVEPWSTGTLFRSESFVCQFQKSSKAVIKSWTKEKHLGNSITIDSKTEEVPVFIGGGHSNPGHCCSLISRPWLEVQLTSFFCAVLI